MNNSSFIEVYKNWIGYGWGWMLIYISSKKTVEYVLFKQENSYYKEVINDKLLELYNKGDN